MKKFLILFVTILLVPIVVSCQKETKSLDTYTILAEFDGDRALKVDMTFDYVCDIPDGTDILKFNIFCNAFREGATFTPVVGDSFGTFKILSVTQNGECQNYQITGKDDNILAVNLNKKIKQGDKTKIGIEYEITLPEGDYRYSKGEQTINLGNFFPILCVYENGQFYECLYYKIGDPFYSKVANFDVSIIVPSEYVVGASGVATSCDVGGDKTKYTYALNCARDFALCLSKDFEIKSKKLGNKTINYYYLTDTDPDGTINCVKKALEYFSETFGEYPYSSFSVCQSDFNEGGMEYPGLVYVNKNLDTLNTLYTAVHETAHQWWYAVVGNNQLEESYLDEGLTEYSTCLFFDENKEFNIDATSQYIRAKKSCMTHQKILEGVRGEKPYMVRNLGEYFGELDYVNTAYNRGMTMLKGYEETFGKKSLKKILKKYYAENKFKIANTNSLISLCGKNGEYLYSFISGNAVI